MPDRTKQLEAIIQDPRTTPAERDAARRELGIPEPSVPQPVQADNALAAALLQSAGKASLADVAYLEVHRFCSERKFDKEAMALFTEWREAYFQTEQGAETRQRLEILMRMYIVELRPDDPELRADLREARRRLGSDPAFLKLFDKDQPLLLTVLRACTRWDEPNSPWAGIVKGTE